MAYVILSFSSSLFNSTANAEVSFYVSLNLDNNSKSESILVF